ncbi:MAG: glycosyltransferase family 1 protein [Actinomycetota bacterium]
MRHQPAAPHILAVVEQFWHRLPGGTALATERTLGALASDGRFRITGLAARHSPPDQGDRAPWQRMPVGSSLRFHRLPRPLLYEAWLRARRPNIDRYGELDSVVWASSGVVPATGRPVAATVHDLDFLANPDRVGWRVRRFFALMWRRIVERADLVVCPTEWVADDCVRRGLRGDRLVVVPWGADEPACPRNEAAGVLADLGLRPGYVLWVGPYLPRKNPKNAALALGRVDAEVVAVAGGSDDEDCRAAWSSLGDRVTRFDRVDARQLSALYRGAGALLYPSLAEGFGLPMVEAMSHGTPVVTSIGGATEEVAGGAAVLVDPRRPDHIADGLEAALRDSALRSNVIDAGRVRAGQLTWEATGKGYAEAFRSLR